VPDPLDLDAIKAYCEADQPGGSSWINFLGCARRDLPRCLDVIETMREALAKIERWPIGDEAGIREMCRVALALVKDGGKNVSMATLERAIVVEARKVLKNPKLRIKDIMEWSTSKMKENDGEIIIRVDDPGVYVAVKREHDHRKQKNS